MGAYLKSEYEKELEARILADEVEVDNLADNYNVSAIDLGMSAGGTVDIYAVLAAYHTAQGSTPTDLYFPAGTYKLSTNITQPATFRYVMANGAMFSVDSGKTLTLNGMIEAGLYQIFTGAGTIAGHPNIGEIPINWFGAKTTAADNHDAILSAITFCQTAAGGTVIIPTGVYNTAPLSLQGCRNIIIKGFSPGLPWGYTSCLKFVSTGSVGLQLSEVSGLGYANEVPSWQAINIKVENIRLDGNSKVDTCINCNYDVNLVEVTAEHAVYDGITFEPQTYPVVLRACTSRLNGRHGLYVKAPYTTVYNIYNCEFANNSGYGMYIEDGNTCSIVDTLCQANTIGGVKIEKKDPALYTHDIFLGNLLFINLYTEANGTLDDVDVDFEGNCGLYTTSYNLAPLVNTGKIAGLTFINCNIIANTPSVGKTTKGLWMEGVYNYNTLGTIVTSTNISYTACGTLDVSSLLLDDSEFTNTDTTVVQRKINEPARNLRATVGHGHIGLRGRMRELQFYLLGSDLVPSASLTMNTLYNLDYIKFYPILQAGSIFGINVMRRVAPTAGTLTFQIQYGYKSYGVLEAAGFLAPLESIVLDSTHNYRSMTFPLTKYLVDASFILGIKVTVSSDYTTSSTAYNYADIIAELFIES
jgi:hypothetical protein